MRNPSPLVALMTIALAGAASAKEAASEAATDTQPAAEATAAKPNGKAAAAKPNGKAAAAKHNGKAVAAKHNGKAAAAKPADEAAAAKPADEAAAAEPTGESAAAETAGEATAASTPAPAPEATPAPAGDVVATPAPAEPAAAQRKWQLGLAFMPMARGEFTYTPAGTAKTVDAALAYGVSLSASYEVLSGLLVGLAPQYTLNVKDKMSSDVAKELDILARVAYAYRPADTITVYAEVLPGYSLILPPSGAVAKGFVMVLGAGTAMDLTERFFATVGLGYQIGFQNRLEETTQLKTRTSYVRVTLGGGVRF
jgi:hypothetical protein